MPNFRKVNGGAPLSISAGDWNAAMDVARAYATSQRDTKKHGKLDLLNTGLVLVRNDSGLAFDRFEALGINGVVISPTDGLDAFQNQILLSGIDYDGGPALIAQEPIADGAIGLACISGVTVATLDAATAIGATILYTDGSAWTVILLGGGGVSSSPGSAIWTPYASPYEASDHPAWWRTVLITQGTVNAQHPIGDGTAGGPYSDDSEVTDDIATDADTDTLDDDETNSSIVIGGDDALDAPVTWHFYLKCDISTDLDATEGTVTGVAIYAGDSWWDGYPVQPVGDAATGAPPDSFYIPLYDITASADPDYTSGPYPAGTLTLPTVWSKNSWWVDCVTFGNPSHDEEGNCIYQERMSLGAI
jgi:hypothetical protein